MKKYYKFPVESDLGIGTQYIEFDNDEWPIRQAECYGDRWFNSNKRYHQELGGMGLCDQQLTEAGMKLGESIKADEFELAWNLSTVVSSHQIFKEMVPSRSMTGTPTAMKQAHLETENIIGIPKLFKPKTLLSNQQRSQERLSQKYLRWKLTLLLTTAICSCFVLYVNKKNFNVISLNDINVINTSVNLSNEPLSFECSQQANSVIIVGRIGKTERPILNLSKFNNGYSPLNRCQIISNKINFYTNNNRVIAITTGIKNGYDIICVSEGVGKGCLKDENNGQILTLGRSGNHSQQEYLANLLDSHLMKHNFLADSHSIAMSNRIYINLNKLIEDGRDYYTFDPS
jgi:Circadian oscillating protein COP23